MQDVRIDKSQRRESGDKSTESKWRFAYDPNNRMVIGPVGLLGFCYRSRFRALHHVHNENEKPVVSASVASASLVADAEQAVPSSEQFDDSVSPLTLNTANVVLPEMSGDDQSHQLPIFWFAP